MARVTSSPVRASTSPHRSSAGEPEIRVEFLTGPDGDEALRELARALARHMARRLFVPAATSVLLTEDPGARDG